MKFVAVVFYCIAVFGAIKGDSDGSDDPESSCNEKELKVIVSFESFNALSIRFFKNQLAPVYEELSKCVKWHFVPCSTSTIVDSVLQCCGGVAECQIDVLHACAAHYYEDNEYALGHFFICMMTDDEQFLKGEECANKAGLDWIKLKNCKPSTHAATFCKNRFRQLCDRHVVHVPGIFFNWRYNQKVDEQLFVNFKAVVCERLHEIGKPCPACPPPCSG